MSYSYLPVADLLSAETQKVLPEGYIGESELPLAVNFFNSHMDSSVVLSNKFKSDKLEDLYNGLRETFPQLQMEEHQFWSYFAQNVSPEDIFFVATLTSMYGNLIELGYWNQVKNLTAKIREIENDIFALPNVTEIQEAFTFQAEMRDEGVFLSMYEICVFKRTCTDEDIVKLLAEKVSAEDVENYAKLGFVGYESIVNTAMKLPTDWVSRIFGNKTEESE